MFSELAGLWTVKLAAGIAVYWGGDMIYQYGRIYKYVLPMRYILNHTKSIDHWHLIESHKTKEKIEIHFAVNHGLAEKEVEPLIAKAKTALGCPVEGALNKGRLIICIYPKGIPRRQTYPSDEFFNDYDCFCIWPCGKSYTGWVVLDLADGPHLLLGGITGIGKSVIINQALYTNIAYHGDSVERYLVDFKYGIEASKFKNHIKIATDIPEASEIVSKLVADMAKRAKVLIKHDVEKWQDLPEEVRKEHKYKLLVIDEFAEISPDLELDKATKKAKIHLMHQLITLLQKGRAVGISGVICTQRPDREIVPGLLKANLQWTMALQVRNEVNSRILLDNDKAVWLRGKGRCLVQTSEIEKEVQVPYLSGKEIRKRLAKVPAMISTVKECPMPTVTRLKKVD